jgi:uncharacterized protein YjbI with pentapeptide repeats
VERKKPGHNRSQEPKKESRWGFRGMTVRDWLELLIVPLALAVIGFWFAFQQDARQHEIEDKRAQAERELEEERTQAAALQTYLDHMTNLLLERNLRESGKGSEVRMLAQARTLAVLRGADASRKTQVMTFLIDLALVQRVDGKDPLIELTGADLDGVNLGDPSPSLVDVKADLSGADLGLADLREAYLLGVIFADANLRGANLSDAALSFATLSDADLREVNLSRANLSWANLERANLETANLSGAILKGAILDEADLRNVEGVTKEELEQQAKSLKGTTMPDGSKHPQ